MNTLAAQDRYPGAPESRRGAPRRIVALRGEVCSSALGRVACDVTDLSRMGCRIACGAAMHLDERLLVRLPSLSAMGARVAWWNGSAAGLEFRQPLGAAVLDHVVARSAVQTEAH